MSSSFFFITCSVEMKMIMSGLFFYWWSLIMALINILIIQKFNRILGVNKKCDIISQGKNAFRRCFVICFDEMQKFMGIELILIKKFFLQKTKHFTGKNSDKICTILWLWFWHRFFRIFFVLFFFVLFGIAGTSLLLVQAFMIRKNKCGIFERINFTPKLLNEFNSIKIFM